MSDAPSLICDGDVVRTDAIDGGTFMQFHCPPTSAAHDGFVHLATISVQTSAAPAFACGYWHTRNTAETFGRTAALRFPYSTYRKMKWDPLSHAGRLFRAAGDLKFPLLATCSSASQRWAGLLFEPFLQTDDGPIPVHCSVWDAGSTRHLVIGVFQRSIVQVDTHPWFGLGRTRCAVDTFSALEKSPVSCSVAILDAASWPELMQLACKPPLCREPATAPSGTRELPPVMDRAWRFFARAADTTHGALAHILRRGAPGQVSEEFKHSHITPELHALELAATLGTAGSSDAAAFAERLQHWATSNTRHVETGDTWCWHTTTRLTNRGLKAFTHHGTGFVGFPGGQATNARHLAEAYQATGSEGLADAALATGRWVRQHQRADGAWPTTVPMAGEVQLKSVGGAEPCIAATAESVRAMLAAYMIDSDRTWLDAADRGLAFVNREDSFFECRGYLRDTAPDEPEGMTAECAIHANLDRAKFGPPEEYIAHATRWGWYAVQWTRPRPLDERGAWMVDGLGHTITPRIDVWASLLLGRAWARLHEATQEPFWRNLAWRQLEGCAALQEPDGGFAETWWYDWPKALTPVPIESTFLVPAFLDLARGFFPDWTPRDCHVSPATTGDGHTAQGPDGLRFEMREVAYRPVIAGALRPLLGLARAGGPANPVARLLGALRLLVGIGSGWVGRDNAPPRTVRVRATAEDESATEWRCGFNISAPPARAHIWVPCLRLHAATNISVKNDALVVKGKAARWRVHLNAPGNVLPDADGAFRFEFAANWEQGVRDYPVEVTCTRVEGGE